MATNSVLQFVSASNVLLVHNGSRTENVIALQNKYPQIHHLVLTENRGFSGGANAGLRRAFELSNDPWVFFITNDCELQTKLTPPSQYGLYAPLIYRRRTGHVDSLGGTFRPLRGKLEHLRSEPHAHRILQKNPTLFKTKYFYVPGTAFYIDQYTMTKLEGFDESLHTYWEDVDLSVRAAKLGLHLDIEPKTQLLHKIGKTCHKDPFYTNVLFRKNRRTISQRHAPAWQRVLQSLILP